MRNEPELLDFIRQINDRYNPDQWAAAHILNLVEDGWTKLPVVYIASPYTVGDQEENTRRQIEMADVLYLYHIIPIVPLLSHYQNKHRKQSYEVWMLTDLMWILRSADAVLRLDGPSRGADLETYFAKLLGIPVFDRLALLLEWAERWDG